MIILSTCRASERPTRLFTLPCILSCQGF